MTLREKIQEDLTRALRGGEVLELSTLRLLTSALVNKEKEKRYKISKEKPGIAPERLEQESRLSEEEITRVIFSEVKKRKESILEFEKGGRRDLADKEKKEMEILQGYLPEQMPEEELRKLAKEAIIRLGAKEMKDMGRVMAELAPKIKGRADGGMASKIVKEFFLK